MPLWFISFFSWVGKIPSPVIKWGGFALVLAAFGWTFWSMGQADAKTKAEIATAKAMQAQAERYAVEMGRVASVIAQVSAEVSTTQVRTTREVSNARREIQSQPGAGAAVDGAAWAAARSAIERMRGDGASDDPPRGGVVAGEHR